jgi:hypothetical protein
MSAVTKSVPDYRAGFFWSGVLMALACVGLILAGNTEPVYQLERTSIPLSWAFAALAVFQFIAAEACHHAQTRANHAKVAKAKKQSAPARSLSPALEA